MRLNPITICAAGLSILSLAGCGLFDSGIEWKAGPYVLIWIDLPSQPTISRDQGDGIYVQRIPNAVFSAGWNERYLVAKQHPNRNKSITNYYILDATKDRQHGDSKDCVTGPLSKAEFESKVKELHLPPFTKTLASLE